MARERPCTRSVHGLSDGQRPWTRAVNTPVYMTTVYMALAWRCIRSVHGRGHVRHGHGHVNGPCTTGTQAVYMPCLRPVPPVFTDTCCNGVNGPRCRGPMDGLHRTEAEVKAETDAKAEAKVIITRPRPDLFVYNSGSTDLLGQRDLLRSFETANYLIGQCQLCQRVHQTFLVHL